MPSSRDQLIMSYYPFARRMARRYTKTKVEYEDLCQEAVIGLCIAADRFDVTRGVKFGTYARWWILSCLSMYVAQNKSIVASYHRCTRVISGDTGVIEETLCDPSPSPEVVTVAADWANKVADIIHSEIDKLEPRRRDILVMRYLRGMTLRDIGDRFGISYERVRQLESQAIPAVRRAIDRRIAASV